VGVGVRGRCPKHLRAKNWMYFPEADCPFYRVTVFSNYSPNNVPVPGEHWSLMAEVSESPYKHVESNALVEEVLAGLGRVQLLPAQAHVVSIWYKFLHRGYPVPTGDRDAILSELLPSLERADIFSRGRFGAWKYEVGNQDHSFMQGVEVVDRIILNSPEITVAHPEQVNRG
jgi:hypothetical protein